MQRPWVCPICHASIVQMDRFHVCIREGHTFGNIAGFPDLRVNPQGTGNVHPSIVDRLHAEYPHRSFHAMVHMLYTQLPDMPSALVKRYILHIETGVFRARAILDAIRTDRSPSPDDTFLEVGCGSGAMLLAATERFSRVLGIDIAPHWLLIAQKRLQEAGRHATFACASATHLPLPDDSVQWIVGQDVLEHVSDPSALLAEAFRVLAPGGVLFLSTPNRWTLGLEPHVRLWGVGFLPRTWQTRYVRWYRKMDYRDVQTLHYFAIRHLLRQTPFREWRIGLPDLPAAHLHRLSRWERMAYPVYRMTKQWPIVRWGWRTFGPLFYIVCRK